MGAKKILFGGVTVAIAIGLGIFFLIRGCLSKFDEKYAITPSLLIKKDGKNIVFSITKYEKTTSYSRNGGMVRKTVNTSFYIQTNDGNTAELIKEKKVKNSRAVKNYPVEVLGSNNGQAWIFLNEPMAFDVMTLEKTADIEMMEEKNPVLKGRFPNERQYYSFSSNGAHLYVTAKDGSKWEIDTKTLLASPSKATHAESQFERSIEAIETLLKKNGEAADSNYHQHKALAIDQLREKKITNTQYEEISRRYYQVRERLDKERDSLWKLQRHFEENKRAFEDWERRLESLNRTNISYNQILINQDTVNSHWIGVYAAEEFEKLNPRISISSLNDETASRSLYFGNYQITNNNNAEIDKTSVQKIAGSFLDGGLLLDKTTAKPINIETKNAFVIVFKNQIGREGTIMLTVAGPQIKSSWTLNTGLTEWADWKYIGNMLYVWGTDNKNLSSGEVNLLHCINLENGSMKTYDFFKKSTRK